MKKRAMKTWDIAGFIVIYCLAILWMFAYGWMPHAVSAAVFPVNASAWESLKLVLLPGLLFYTIEYFAIGRRFKNYVFARGIGLLVMAGITVFGIYFYRGMLDIGYVQWVDLIILAAAVIIGQLSAHRITMNRHRVGFAALTAFITVVLLACSVTLTYLAPKSGVFLGPVKHTFGYYEKLPDPVPEPDDTEDDGSV